MWLEKRDFSATSMTSITLTDVSSFFNLPLDVLRAPYPGMWFPYGSLAQEHNDDPLSFLQKYPLRKPFRTYIHAHTSHHNMRIGHPNGAKPTTLSQWASYGLGCIGAVYEISESSPLQRLAMLIKNVLNQTYVSFRRSANPCAAFHC